MTEATGVEAKTIHRFLEVDPKGGGFKRNENTLISMRFWASLPGIRPVSEESIHRRQPDLFEEPVSPQPIQNERRRAMVEILRAS